MPYSSGTRRSSSTAPSTASTYTSAPTFTYATGYTLNTYSATLAVGSDASVTVTESFDVVLPGTANGIQRGINPQHHYTGAMRVLTPTSPNGTAKIDSTNFLSIGNDSKNFKGPNNFSATYKLVGALLPYPHRPMLAWRSDLNRPFSRANIKVIFPDARAASECRIVIVPIKPYLTFNARPIQTEVNGMTVTAAIDRPIKESETIEVWASFPEHSLNLNIITPEFERPILKDTLFTLSSASYRARISTTLVSDVTATYEFLMNNPYAQPSLSRKEYYFISDPQGNVRMSEYNTWKRAVYSYNFSGSGFAEAKYDNDTVSYVKIPQGTSKTTTSYTTYGNHYLKDELFIDIVLPGMAAKKTGKIDFSIEFPASVKPEEVRPTFLLERSTYQDLLLRPIDVPYAWEGNRLVGSYLNGLYDDQILKMRIYLPKEKFSKPFIAMRGIMFLRNAWYFSMGVLVAIITIIAIGAIIAIGVVITVRSGRGIRELPRIRKREKKKDAAKSILMPQNILQSVQSHDPGFTPEYFLARVTEIATRLQASWGSGDMKPVRNYVSQGVYNRFRLQMDLMKTEEGVEDLTSDFTITEASVIGISTSHNYQSLHVRITAQIRDLTVDASLGDEDKRKLLADEPLETFTEIYSFTRRKGAKTDTTKDWLKGQCPNCGFVPDNFGEVNKCPSCGTIYNSGEFEWVLSEITQAEEWKQTSWEDIPGLKELETKNLSINREVIEDRASYLFWRWIFARVKGMKTAIARDATKAFLDSFNADKTAMSEIAVGAVDLQRVQEAGDTVRADVLILWSAAFSRNAEPIHHEHVFTLAMPLSMKNEYGLAEHSCPNCGAPLPELDALTCQYCGADLPHAVNDWLLESIAEK